ncbi:MAG: PorV/PorQ family protein, partial [Bacteroidetes bacterium]|nr:PorV/PorQ family protein [Bacteroidota bacterium]
MTKNIKYIGLSLAVAFSAGLKAGNPERSGQAGAPQLLINPYARTSGMAGANSARVKGLEAQFLNIAGTAYTRKTEIIFSHTNWLAGTGVNVNAFGLTQGVGETGTIGFGVVAMGAGAIDITTPEQPEGGIGTFNPSFMNLSLSYAKMFSDRIYGGINVKLINEKIPNANALGVALDAGIQYHAGEHEQIHIGIALKNWGPKMKYQGDGLSLQMTSVNVNNLEYQLTASNRSNPFELPTLVNIGAAYDFYLTKDSTGTDLSKDNRLSLNATFTSNS